MEEEENSEEKNVTQLNDKTKLAFLKKEYRKLSTAYNQLLEKSNKTTERSSDYQSELHLSPSEEESVLKTEIDLLRVENEQLKEENKLLNEEMKNFRENQSMQNESMQRQQKRISLMSQDREMLVSEFTALKEEVNKLKADIIERDECLEAMARKYEIITLKLHSFETLPASRPVEKEEEDMIFRQKFSLPDTEFMMEKYNCFNEKLAFGTLYVTPNYLCFDQTFPPGRTNIRTISIKDLSRVEPHQSFKIPLRKSSGHGLKLVLLSEEAVTFSGFVNRDLALANITARMNQVQDPLLE